MSKDTWGEGGIAPRKDRPGYYVVTVSDPASKSGRARRSVKGKRAAQEAYREMLARVDHGKPAKDSSVRLEAYIEQWLVSDRSEYGRNANSVATYATHFKNTWIPRLGHMKLRDITVVDVEDVLHKVAAEKGYSEQSLRSIRSALSRVLNDALRARLVTFNACQGAQIPRDSRPTKQASMPEVEAIRELLALTEGEELGRLLRVLAGTGMRVGEALGLYWGDIDLDHGQLVVERTTSRDRTGKAVMGGRTKNKKVRTLPLPAFTVAALREQQVFVKKEKLKAGAKWQDNNLVFPTSIGTIGDASRFRRLLYAVQATMQAAHELDPSKPVFAGGFHTFRHFFSGVGLSSAEAAQVQQILGHTTLRMTTGTYGHLVPGAAKDVSEAVSRALGMDAG